MPEPVDHPAAAEADDLDTDIELPSAPEVLEDILRTLARQQATIDRLADSLRTVEAQSRSAADIPLLLDLLAIRGDAAACATTAESDRERAGFAAQVAAVERLMSGRGGTLVSPAVDSDFSAATMEAAEIIRTDDPALDRTVDRVVVEGLRLTESNRSIRPALVVVRRYKVSSPAERK